MPHFLESFYGYDDIRKVNDSIFKATGVTSIWSHKFTHTHIRVYNRILLDFFSVIHCIVQIFISILVLTEILFYLAFGSKIDKCVRCVGWMRKMKFEWGCVWGEMSQIWGEFDLFSSLHDLYEWHRMRCNDALKIYGNITHNRIRCISLSSLVSSDLSTFRFSIWNFLIEFWL